MGAFTIIIIGIVGYLAFQYGKYDKESEIDSKIKEDFNNEIIKSYKLLDLVEVTKHIGSNPISDSSEEFRISIETDALEKRYYQNRADLRVGFKGVVVKIVNEYDHSERKIRLFIFPLEDYWKHRVKKTSDGGWFVDLYHREGELAFGCQIFDLRKIRKIENGFKEEKKWIIKYLDKGYRTNKYFGEEFNSELKIEIKNFLKSEKKKIRDLNEVGIFSWHGQDLELFNAIPFLEFEDTNERGIFLANGIEVSIEEILNSIYSSLSKNQLSDVGIFTKGQKIIIKDLANLGKFAIGRKKRKGKIIGYAHLL